MPFQRGNKFGGRRSRGPVKARSPTPQLHDEQEDESMVDGEGDGDADGDGDGQMPDVGGATPQDDDAEAEVATPSQDDDDDDEEEDAPPTITSMPRRRGRGRPAGRRSGRAERIDYGTPLSLEANEASESGTPFKRRRGRPEGSGRGSRGSRGGRARRRGNRAETAPVVIDKNGNALDVVNDEVQVDQDDEGDTKVDQEGNLQGGREYRVRTFKIQGKGDRLYMLSTEPARCCGFRDSYLFFTKHPKLYKVLLDEEQKKDLIDRDILPSSYKGRNIGVVTARSVFREFGARIVVGGKKVTDDYKVTEAKANGEVEGEIADPDDRIPEHNEEYNRNRYVAWFGASEVYRNVGQGGGGQQSGKPGPLGKRRAGVTVQNWQFLHAREASRFNSGIAAVRRSAMDGVYDTHTNMMFYPSITQPSHAKWEQIPPRPIQSDEKPLANGLTIGHGHLPNGTTGDDHDIAMEIDDKSHAVDQSSRPTIFSDVPPVVSRNFAVIDTTFKAPTHHVCGFPGPDGSLYDPTSGPNGLSSIPDDIADELPEDCRRAFEEAKKAEMRWKGQWGTEAQSALRGELKIGFNGYPV
ncbi:hypothetical protein KC332_g11252 [Hortaea werneckii]|uniref:Uncharacterized protein n=2 Tax=Hortaea werneckii TaxID=91943 RepID=A0A3M7J5K2_HORWE|nr:hypothetical protein KC358_g9818 [Hortaea werneckii]OTA38470.1 hypothetical protein BTJ68_01640 [Hortaea werneckii EXF-2000]KAI6824681.1 hypothetical protein KC350_g8964 [Hortaea werneckii]KAI6927887.1 hypothetical protein KC341_g11868 [Hortaea werneckii]KAI6961353.1 hypothetical protein KC321_g12362 [Hortaea werneckii]